MFICRDDHSPLRNATYRRLFSAQLIALVGTGLTTVALTLLAYDLADRNAGAVVGIALALKMVVYVFGAPLITALATRLPRRRLLVTLDLLRAATVVGMLFVTEVWQVYVLIVLVNACSAGFTPTFQAAIPDVLDDEPAYTRALSLSRLAYELEGLLSPALAAALLAFMSYSGLFAVNGIAFLCSAALVLSTRLPARRPAPDAASWRARVTAGTRQYLATPRLRGLLALNVAVAAASATVVVNSVVYVRDQFGRDAADVAWALGAAGAGAMVAALLLPRLLKRVHDRTLMLAGGALLPLGLALAATVVSGFAGLLAVWLLLGAGLSLVQTPSGLLVTRSGSEQERPGLFAAQFSLSHACWLATYPVAGVLGVALGLATTAWLLAALAAAAVVAAALLWPAAARGHVRLSPARR
ncbi:MULTISPECIES: MFS transporter [unclassified Conexibacter]|uniref:MFS transporter n=1 Tax=unclassified Conexibacter TaxID=2627773 RepID=UPI00271F3757|nr:MULTISPECIES: MFS transporter [unclassified Conexibacter]MDO8188130.1 MFS transporter [Conexibacter sp. CPCC 205706]